MKLISVLFCAMLVTGCTFNANATFQNEKQEKEKAESVAGNLYMNISNKNFKANQALFSTAFYAVTPKDSLDKMFVKTAETLGDYKDMKLLDWNTSRATGTNPKTEYVLVYEVTYAKFKAKETLSLIKENNKVKITGYFIDSKGFIK